MIEGKKVKREVVCSVSEWLAVRRAHLSPMCTGRRRSSTAKQS